jgi:hypothetical protein
MGQWSKKHLYGLLLDRLYFFIKMELKTLKVNISQILVYNILGFRILPRSQPEKGSISYVPYIRSKNWFKT